MSSSMEKIVESKMKAWRSHENKKQKDERHKEAQCTCLKVIIGAPIVAPKLYEHNNAQA
jgi:hypothetical protein